MEHQQLHLVHRCTDPDDPVICWQTSIQVFVCPSWKPIRTYPSLYCNNKKYGHDKKKILYMRNSFWDHLFTSRLSNFDPVIDYFVFDSVLQPYGALVGNFFFLRRDISFRSKCWQHNCKSPPVCEHSWTESAVGFGITVELGHTAQTYWKRSTIQFSSFQLFLLVSLFFSIGLSLFNGVWQ